MVHRAGGRDALHEVAWAAVGADVEAAADDLAHGDEVGRDAHQLLRATGCDAEAGHHLVEDEQHAVLAAEAPQAGEIAGSRQHQPHVAGDRLDEERGDLLAMSREERLHRDEVVVRRDQRVVGHRLRHAGRGRRADGGGAGARCDQERIAVTVVAAGDLHQLVAAGGGARQA
jgi:hypothetical protein